MMKTYDVIALGIAVVDIIAKPVDQRLFERDNMIIDDISIYTGGDAANQSVDLKKLGLNVSLCCRIGADSMGNLFLSEIKAQGVDTTHITVAQESVTSTAIALVSPKGDRNIICRRGNNYDFCFEDIDLDYIADTRALSIGSLYGLPKLEDDGLREVLAYAKNNGVLIFADMGSDKKGLKLKGLLDFLPYVDYFMPSEAESLHLTGFSDCRKAAEAYMEAGAKNIIIKLGAKGVYAQCEGFTGFIDPFRIQAKDTTGSGDAFCSGFIYGILQNWPVKNSLEFATACGAYNAMYIGAAASPLSTPNIRFFASSTPKNPVSRVL